ncbi:MAG: hypothetical protein JNM57_04610 [Cyclobacteriaceae bacterium]|nr:hypothetical protein [Cyclobacteriaceae bacterium]
MKNLGIIHIILFLLLMLVYRCAGAQDYVILAKGDTLYGDIKPIAYTGVRKVQVVGKDKKKATYSIEQTRGYFLKGEIFAPVRGESGYVFMKLAKPGYLSLYLYQIENQASYDGQYLLKKDGRGMEVPNLGFKKYLSNFLAEDEELADRILKGELGKKDLNQIIDSYNQWIDGRTIDHGKLISVSTAQKQKISSWDILEEKVKNEPDFEGKSSALEMITEIKSKISKSEKIPNFLIEGLKSSLTQSTVKPELENALKELNQ